MVADEGSPGVEVERRRSRRSVRFILTVVAASVVLLLGLTAWVTLVPYDATVEAGEGEISCDATDDRSVAEAEADIRRRCESAEDELRSQRRTTAVTIGTVVVVVALAVSTWPSRR